MPDDSKQIEDALFKQMPKDIKKLNLQARSEARARTRYDWAIHHPNNPRVAGKKLNKP